MTKDPFLKRYMSLNLVLSLVFGLVLFFITSELAFLFILFLSIQSLLFYYFSTQQQHAIRHLSESLRQIRLGNYTLDIRDNVEGELSLLKSEIYKVTVSLRENQAQLIEEKQKLTDAIADISHQLKTPLMALQVSNELLLNPKADEVVKREFTVKQTTQLKRMQWLVSSLLKLSKLETHTVQFQYQQTPVEDLVSAVLHQLQIPLEIKEQHLSTCIADGLMLNCDVSWLSEALLNIIKNAIEYTPIGGTICVNASQNSLYTVIEVSDSGPGVLAKDLPHLFKRFYKGSCATSESVGIGLAIAKQIVQNHQGEIKVETADTGTTFKLKFYHC